MFIEDSTDVTVQGCSFNQTGGNALMLSNNVQDSAVTDNEFVHTGDSAIATLGSSDMIFGTEPTYPNRITIARNHIREVGICTDHSSKERRRPLFWRLFWTVTQRAPGPLVPFSGFLASRRRKQRKNGEKTSKNGRDMVY